MKRTKKENTIVLELVCLVTEPGQQQIFSFQAGQPGGSSRNPIVWWKYVPVWTCLYLPQNSCTVIYMYVLVCTVMYCVVPSCTIMYRNNVLVIVWYILVHCMYFHSKYILVHTSTSRYKSVRLMIYWYIWIQAKRYMSIVRPGTYSYIPVHTSISRCIGFQMYPFCIWMVYTWYIHGISFDGYTWYIHGIHRLYTS